MSTIVHVLNEVYMGLSHGGLTEILKERTGREGLKKGELAVFINRKWTACKILAPDNVLLYYREPSGGFITIEDIKRIPTALGGKLFTFGGNRETIAVRAFEKVFGKRVERLKRVS